MPEHSDKAGGEVAWDLATVYAEMAKRNSAWNSYGMTRESAVKLAFKVCQDLYTHPQPSALPDDVVKDAKKFRKGWQAGLEMAASNWETWYGFDKNGAAEMCREIKHDYAAIDAAMLKEGNNDLL